MIDKLYVEKSKIYNEFSEIDSKYFFDIKQKKFLQNIDTFYYSVKFDNSFLKNSEDAGVLYLRNYFEQIYKKFDSFGQSEPFELYGSKQTLIIKDSTFAGFYKIGIQCKEMFDIFIAPEVPESADNITGEKLGYSDTSEIIVQIRSYMLWMYGAHESFERSYEVVKLIADMFRLTIQKVQENRIDYCWHTNYFHSPETFFNIDNFRHMEVSRFKRIRQDYEKVGTSGEVELDYLCEGKRSDKCFLRIYLKSKEVVEQGYKSWFFKFWLFNGLINRYDLYCLEFAFLKKSWRQLDVGRLEFYIEFGNDLDLIQECKDLINKDVLNYDNIRVLASRLTPSVTKIMNVEYQVMRGLSKSYCLFPLKDNSSKGAAQRIYDILDNRPLITDYHTNYTFRLVTKEGDSNKSRRDFCPFWHSLRSTKCIDAKLPDKYLKLCREYSRNLNKELMKKRVINSAIMYSFYSKGMQSDDIMIDCADALLRMNDNDIKKARVYKNKKRRQLNQDELSTLMDKDKSLKTFSIIDADGVLYNSII